MTVIDSPESGRRSRCARIRGLRQRVHQAAAPGPHQQPRRSPVHRLTGSPALETGIDADGEFSRRFLIRACYLNPSVFSQFRPFFTRAGFRVVDCPSLTQQGKSSADINLVLDAVDALSAETRYDEFVILSADADFTPLALRCRAADRRVTIITAGPAASAYRAVADTTVITADELAELVKHPDLGRCRGSRRADSSKRGERLTSDLAAEHPAELDRPRTARPKKRSCASCVRPIAR